MKMEASRSLETFVNFSHTTRRHMPSFRNQSSNNFKYQRLFMLVMETNQQLNHDVEDYVLALCEMGMRLKLLPMRTYQFACKYLHEPCTTEYYPEEQHQISIRSPQMTNQTY